jgi:FkbM family methyltransferase
MSHPLRRLTGHSRLMPLTARVLCARLVRETTRFFAGELLRPPGVRIYRVRRSGVRVAVRHRGSDAATLAEVFRNGWYEPPAGAAQRLAQARSILDLGANVGMFGAFAVARWPDAEVVGYEPDPDNATAHERAIAANGLGNRWRLVRAAAGAHDGEVRFAAGHGASSHLADVPGAGAAAETIAVAMQDVLDQMTGADLVKIDIEGGEWELLRDPRFTATPPVALVLEYHPAACRSDDPRGAALEALHAAGMRTQPLWHDAATGVGMAWAWRP